MWSEGKLETDTVVANGSLISQSPSFPEQQYLTLPAHCDMTTGMTEHRSRTSGAREPAAVACCLSEYINCPSPASVSLFSLSHSNLSPPEPPPRRPQCHAARNKYPPKESATTRPSGRAIWWSCGGWLLGDGRVGRCTAIYTDLLMAIYCSEICRTRNLFQRNTHCESLLQSLVERHGEMLREMFYVHAIQRPM